MKSRRVVGRGLAWVATALLIGCDAPTAYQNLASAQQLRKNPNSDGHVPLAYAAPGVDMSRYSSVILDPVTIYSGSDSQFDSPLRGAGPECRQTIAEDLRDRFAAKLATKYALVQAPAPNAMRVHVTLTGAQTSTPVVSMLGQLSPGSIVVNGMMTAADMQEGFTGSVTYAVEAYDSQTNKLVRAFIAKQYPWAENPLARIGSCTAAEAGVSNGANQLVAQLNKG